MPHCSVKVPNVIPYRERWQRSVILSGKQYACGIRISLDGADSVPPEQLPNLAQAFYRPDAARTRDDGGVGLGLYLCKLVALAHRGTFTIANASPGLVITVTLPPINPSHPT